MHCKPINFDFDASHLMEQDILYHNAYLSKNCCYMQRSTYILRPIYEAQYPQSFLFVLLADALAFYFRQVSIQEL